MNRDAINAKVLDLLGRFGSIDRDALMDEVSKVNAKKILQSGVLVDSANKVQLGQVGVMEALLTMALGGKPSVSMPKTLDPVRDALVLFLKLNNTDRFGYTDKDTPQTWAFRIIDSLFAEFAQRKALTLKDRVVLLNVSRNPLWQAAFTYSLGLYLQVATRGKAFIQAVEKPAITATVNTFRACLEARRAKLPKLKYGNPLASFKEITEYAIGQYFNGQDLNDAMSQSLVQAQLGTSGDAGKERFESFLSENRISPDMFPTTANQLHVQVNTAVQFRNTEEELSNVLYLFAKQTQQEKRMEAMFQNFAEAAFPVAAKFSRMMSFSGLELNDAAGMLVRWLSDSAALADVRSADRKTRIEAVLETITREELTDLLAFRSGRTSTSLDSNMLTAYVAGRVKMLPLNAMNQKMQRVSSMLMGQVAAAEQFVARPGGDMPKEMTFGIDEFFRTLRSVFRDIFEAADKNRQIQTQSLDEFRNKFGPLSTISVLVPRDPKMPLPAWTDQARKELNGVSNFVFEKQMIELQKAKAV